jgi:hypothetical protein
MLATTDGQALVAALEAFYASTTSRLGFGNKPLTGALDCFYRSLNPSLERFRLERQKIDRTEATQFSVFDYIEPDENRLSDIIHDLLDPYGQHGQGTLFLSAFLEAIGVPTGANQRSWRPKREDPALYCASPSRRLDITLDAGDFGVGIENKPFAAEGDDQLKDYWVHLRTKYGENYILVYLPGDGSDPVSLGRTNLARLRSAGRFRSLSYPTDLCQWLKGCCKDCKAEKVRWFLRAFIDYVQGTFSLGDADEVPTNESD